MTEPQKPAIPDPSYQDKDIRMKPVVLAIVVILGVAALSMVLMKMLFDHYQRRAEQAIDGAVQTASARNLTEGPLLQVKEDIDLKDYLAWEQDLLTSYGWNVQTNGTAHVRIPLERARALMLERGFPVRPAQDPPEEP